MAGEHFEINNSDPAFKFTIFTNTVIKTLNYTLEYLEAMVCCHNKQELIANHYKT